jgi:hypothetical protein
VETCTLKYIDYSNVTKQQTFNILSAKGFDEPDQVQLFPPIQNKKLDGTIDEQIKGFRRVITMDLGVVASSVDRKTVNEFLESQTKSIIYQGSQVEAEEVFVNLQDISGYENRWLYDCSLAKYYTLQVLESRIRQTWPVIFPPSDNMIGYTINHVKIVGTQTSPEAFQTNSGKLQYNYGTTPFPTMSLTSYIITVVCNGTPYQDAKINQVGTITQAGSNVSFYLAVSDTGNPSGDGFFYADITFLMQTIV